MYVLYEHPNKILIKLDGYITSSYIDISLKILYEIPYSPLLNYVYKTNKHITCVGVWSHDISTFA